ncbi:MAG: MBL fold metallo-hydrolase [Parachlamydiaceae bacterium]|nr:MBL fold metallo-hydrolase [Parachlamydiaceae bacterium]
MTVHKITTPGLAINTYLLIDPETRNGAVIDATRDIKPLITLIEREGCSVTAILETHVHADFISGSKELKSHLNEKTQIFCSSLGGKEWVSDYADQEVVDRQVISLGSLKIQAWHTPGHTPEHLMWVVFGEDINPQKAQLAFTGDFLLFGSLGRPDLLGEKETRQLSEFLYESVFSVLSQLPDSTVVYPAHGAGSLCGKSISKQSSSTLEIERQTNPFLVYMSQNEWIINLLKGMPKPPAYFARMKHLNISGIPYLKTLIAPKELSAKAIVEWSHAKGVILDLRSKEEFASVHITGALSIPLQGSFVNWVSFVAPFGQPIALIVNDLVSLDQALLQMRLVGLDNIQAFYIWDPALSRAFDGTVSAAPFVDPSEVMEKTANNNSSSIFKILDVRSAEEWDSGHIKNAIHCDLSSLNEQIGTLPHTGTYAVICGSGYRASIAASLLQNAGFPSLYNVAGGMSEWNKRGLPVVKENEKTGI